MMSIVEQFGKKNGRREPEIPPMPRVVSTAPAHEKHAQALAYVGDLTDENTHLRSENTRLQQDLSLAVMRIKDLERDKVEVYHTLEAYRRYSVEVKTHLQHISDAAMRANEAALEAGEHIPPPIPEAALKAVEKELASAAETKGPIDG